MIVAIGSDFVPSDSQRDPCVDGVVRVVGVVSRLAAYDLLAVVTEKIFAFGLHLLQYATNDWSFQENGKILGKISRPRVFLR